MGSISGGSRIEQQAAARQRRAEAPEDPYNRDSRVIARLNGPAQFARRAKPGVFDQQDLRGEEPAGKP